MSLREFCLIALISGVVCLLILLALDLVNIT